MKTSHDTIDIIELFYKKLEASGPFYVKEKIPVNMVNPEPDKPRSWRWKPIKNTLLTFKDFQAWEEKLGVKYPEIYKTWFLSHHMFTLKFERIYLIGNHPKNRLSELESLMKPSFIENGFLPIGRQDLSGDILVLDFNDEVISGRPSIKLCKHDSENNKFIRVRPEIVFSSFEHLLQCFTVLFDAPYFLNLVSDIPKIYNLDPLSKSFWNKEIEEIEEWNDMFDMS